MMHCLTTCPHSTIRGVYRSSLAEAEKKYNEMLNQLKEKDALVENLRRKEATFQEEKTRFHVMFRCPCPSMEST